MDTTPPSHNSTIVPLPIDEAFALVCDPTLYPRWLVGAQAIRRVDPSWPAAGSRFEHRIGAGPLRLPGSTTVRDLRAPHVLALGAGMGVLGEASVRIELRDAGDATEVRIVETPRRGPAAAAGRLLGPVVRLALWGRNAVSLEHLARLAEERRR